jgi:diguanylate cyclase (GGDEF)-like protein
VFDIELLAPLSSCTVGMIAGYVLRIGSLARSTSPARPAAEPTAPRAAEVGDAIRQLGHELAQRVDQHHQVVQQTCQDLRSTPEESSVPDPVGTLERLMEALDRLVTANEHLQRDLDDAQLRLQMQTEQLQSPQERAQTDPLTLARNRSFLDRYLHEQLLQATPSDHIALILIEIDNFNRLNEACGQLTGDGVLQQAAQRLLLGVRDQGLVARYDSATFAVVVRGPQATNARDLSQRLAEPLGARPMFVGGRELDVTTTHAMAMWRPDESVLAWQERAEAALHRARQVGPSGTATLEDDVVTVERLDGPAFAETPSSPPADQPQPLDPDEFLRSHGGLIADLQRQGIMVQLLVISSGSLLDKFWQRAISLHVRSVTRGFDRIGPLGRDHWCVCFPNCDAETVKNRAERIRAGLLRFGRDQGHHSLCPQLGFGIATALPGETGRAFLDRALGAAVQSLHNSGHPHIATATLELWLTRRQETSRP